MDMLDARYSAQGIPVIIGEFGCPKENKEEASVRRFLTAVCEAALSRGGICPVLWDTTDLHYDRTAYRMTDSVLNEQLLAIRDQYVPQDVCGDVTGDGVFSVADVVAVQKYLVCDGDLNDWKQADLREDGQLDGFDLCMMKQLLIA